MSLPAGSQKVLRWNRRQLALIAAIFSIGDVWAIGAKRSGKSTAIVEAIRQCVYEWEPEVNGIMAAPSYGQLERNLLEPWRELVPSELYKEVHDNKNPHLLCYAGEGREVKVYLASGHYPKRIEGATVGWAAFTELQDGEAFWHVVKARVSDMRAHKLRCFGDGLPEEGWLARTLEGSEASPVHRMMFTVHDNAANLHPDYIEKMLKNMTPAEKVKYIDGLFGGSTDSIYPYFRRTLHAAGHVSYLVGVKILIGLDFNNRQQSAVFCQWHQGTLFVFDELALPGTVQDQAIRIKAKLADYGIKDAGVIRSKVVLIPDASGKAAQHARGESSFAVLEAAGFVLLAGAANPYVEDRDTSVNVLMENALKENHLVIDRRCARLVDSLAGLRTTDRENDPFSDSCDALGYVVWQVAPQRRKSEHRQSLTEQDLSQLSRPRATR